MLWWVLFLFCRWNPDRFSSTGAHGKRGNEFCPFGIHSKRKCPGYLFSYFEVSTFVALLIQRFVELALHFGSRSCNFVWTKLSEYALVVFKQEGEEDIAALGLWHCIQSLYVLLQVQVCSRGGPGGGANVWTGHWAQERDLRLPSSALTSQSLFIPYL